METSTTSPHSLRRFQDKMPPSFAWVHTRGPVSDEELHRITVDYTAEFARVLRAASPDAVFSFLSGSGAERVKETVARSSTSDHKVLSGNRPPKSPQITRVVPFWKRWLERS